MLGYEFEESTYLNQLNVRKLLLVSFSHKSSGLQFFNFFFLLGFGHFKPKAQKNCFQMHLMAKSFGFWEVMIGVF